MALGTLSLDLIAKLAQFERDMGQAARITEQNANKMSSAISGVQGFLKGMAGALSVAAVVAWGKSVIDAADDLRDLAQAAGISAVSLGGLGFAASQAGGDLNTMATASKFLNKTISEAASGSKEQAALFKGLGVEVLDASGQIRKMDDVLIDVADAFAGMPEGPERVATALALFGKSGQAMIPILIEGGAAILQNKEYFEQYSGITKELTENADAFNDTLGQLKVQANGVSNGLIDALLPALNAIAEGILHVAENADLFKTINKFVSEGLANWAIEGASIAKSFEVAGYQIGGVLAKLKLIASGGTVGQFNDISAAVKADVDRANADFNKFKEKLRPGSITGGGATGDFGPTLPGRPFTPTPAQPVKRDGGAGASSSKTKEIIDANRTALAQYVSGLQKELDSLNKITEVQKAEQFLSSLGKFGQIEQVRTLVLELAKEADAKELLLTREKDAAETRAKTAAINDRYLAGINSDNEALVRGNEALRSQLEEIGLTVKELDALRIARLDAGIAAEQLNLITAQSVEGNDAEVAAIERRIRLLQQQRDLTLGIANAEAAKDEKDQAIQRTETIAQSISEGIMTGFRNGQSAVDIFLNELKAQFAKTILTPAIKPIIEAGNSLISGALKFLLPGFATGIDYVPRDMTANIHKGERILTAEENKAYGKSRGGEITNNYWTVGDIASMEMVKKAIAASQRQTYGAFQRSQLYGG